MKDYKNWVWILLFGSLWGISEVIGGEAFYRNNVPHASVWLSAWAFFVLALGRGLVNKPGSSTVIGGVAALYKLINAAPYFCHLLGIFFLALAFDVFASVLIKEDRKRSFWPALCGAISAYGGYALFALVITYIVRYDPWVAGGWPKVSHHISVGGSYAALTALLAVPLGLWLGVNGWILARRRPRWAYAGALVALAVLWTLGRFIG
jgi:hypothetical protein